MKQPGRTQDMKNNKNLVKLIIPSIGSNANKGFSNIVGDLLNFPAREHEIMARGGLDAQPSRSSLRTGFTITHWCSVGELEIDPAAFV